MQHRTPAIQATLAALDAQVTKRHHHLLADATKPTKYVDGIRNGGWRDGWEVVPAPGFELGTY